MNGELFFFTYSMFRVLKYRPIGSGIKYVILPELIENVSGIIPGNIAFNIALILSQLL